MNSSGNYRTCEICGKPIQNDGRARYSKQKTCSRVCDGKRRTSRGRIPFECPICGLSTTLIRSKSKEIKTCGSIECKRIFRARAPSRKVNCECFVCKTPFWRYPSALSYAPGSGKFCSKSCAFKGLTDEQLARRKAAIIAGHARNRSRRSGLEILVQDILTVLGIEFTAQHPIPTYAGYAYFVDFLLPSSVVLEVNGTYWHCDPRVYPYGPTKRQVQVAQRYADKKSGLKNLGYRLIEVWEIDLKANPRGAVEAALKEAYGI